ncbi:hypothetical protein VTG60DRAFT_5504 [Thermothelomyces hinnuleus]
MDLRLAPGNSPRESAAWLQLIGAEASRSRCGAAARIVLLRDSARFPEECLAAASQRRRAKQAVPSRTEER